MGIKQTRTLPTGYAAEYGRILSLDCLHVDGKRVDAVVGWYKDETARRDGAQPAEYERCFVLLTPDEVDAILAVVYGSEGFRALNPEAEDVLEEDEAPEGENIAPSKETGKNDTVD